MQLKPPDILELLTAALVVILKQVPGVGMVIEYVERIEAAQQMRSIFNKFDDVEQRMAALEGLATIPAAEVESIVRNQLRGSAEQNAYVLDVVQHITRQVTRKVNSTRRLGAPRLQDDENFYLDLIPTQRPHDYRGQAVPQHPRWILQELIGSGGFGEVWRAQHETLPEQEAIKFCHEESQREFLQREVNTLKLVQEKLAQHPNIVRLKDVNLTQAPYWLAFEYIAGGTLLDVMQQRHLAWGEALHVMTGIVQGVAAAHALGIVHRDLKPANILLTPDGVPKVTDFGLGKVLQQSSTTTNLGMGTQHYAAPEQISGSRADPADDVYALGVIFWQLATHTLNGPQFARASLANSRVPELARQLIMDCVERPRGQRPANAQVLLQRLQQLPLTLATNAGLSELRQQADQVRNAAQQQQTAQFAAQLQAQKQQAQKLQQEQAARMQQFVAVPQPAVVPDGKFAEQWSALQQLVAAVQKIQATFDQELQQEQQRIETQLQKALDKLGPFRSEPRDEEFEYKQEYEERVVREKAQYETQRQAIQELWQRTKNENLARIKTAKQAALADNQQAQAKLQALRYPFQCSKLTDYNYVLDAGKLYCQGIIKQLFPTEQLRLNFVIAMPREQGRLYRNEPQRFQINGQLALQAKPLAIVVVEAQLALAGEGRFSAVAQVAIETDVEALEQEKQRQRAIKEKEERERREAQEREEQRQRAIKEREEQARIEESIRPQVRRYFHLYFWPHLVALIMGVGGLIFITGSIGIEKIEAGIFFIIPILTLYVILTDGDDGFFNDLERIFWLIVLYIAIAQLWYTFKFAAIFNGWLLPLPYSIAVTLGVIGLYIWRLKKQFPKIVAREKQRLIEKQEAHEQWLREAPLREEQARQWQQLRTIIAWLKEKPMKPTTIKSLKKSMRQAFSNPESEIINTINDLKAKGYIVESKGNISYRNL